MVLHPLHSDLTFFWLHVTYTVSLAFPARQYSSIDGLPVSVCVCVWFCCPAWALWALGKAWVLHVKRPHPCAPFIKKLCSPQLVYSVSQHKSELPSHNPTSVSPCPPFFPLLFFSPPLYTLIQLRNKWVTVRDKLRQRSEEGEICSCVVERPISVKGNPPLSQRELHLLCKWSTRGLFLSRLHRPPSQKKKKKDPTPVVAFPPRFSPLSLFSLCYSSVPEFIFLKKRREILQKDNRSVSTTLLKVSCHTHTDLPPIGKLLSGTKDCHGNHTTSCSECSQDKATLYHAVLGPTHQVSLFRIHLTTSNVLRLLPSWEIKNLLEVVSLTIRADSVLVIREVLSSVPVIHPVNPL